MDLAHACFISFPRGSGKDTQFANLFFEEFAEHLAAIDKTLSVFKVDRCEKRRMGDDWTLWIQRELCHSAMMMAICAPNYFRGSPGCVSEFQGMEKLIERRTQALGEKANDWLIGIRLKDKLPMPALNPYPVCDFLDCCASPEKVRRVHKYRVAVEDLADRVYAHWEWLHSSNRHERLATAKICDAFTIGRTLVGESDPFPHAGGVQ